MAKFDVDVGGATYEVEAPDEGTAWKWARAEHVRSLGKQGAAPKPVEKPIVHASGADELAGNPVTRFALGAASPVIGAAQLAGNAIPGVGEAINAHLRELEAAKKRGMEARGDGTFDVSGVAGAVLSPPALAAMNVPLAGSVMGRAGQGMATGAAFGAATPVTEGDNYWGSKAAQTGTGLLLGGAIPLGIDAARGTAKAVRNIADPWLPGGIDRAIGRTANEAAGSRRDAVIEALERNREIVPGSRPTATQAASDAGSAEFSGLGRAVEYARPSEAFARSSEQEWARQAAIQTIGQNEPRLMAAIHNRTVRADPLYASARNSGNVVDSERIVGKIDWMLGRNPGNRELVTELKNLRAGLVDDAGNPRTNAQQVASVLDGIKAAIAKEENKFIQGSLTSLKDDLVRSIPGYGEAQRTFAEMSVPVNRMQIGQALEKQLSNSLGTAERPSSFGTAVRDSARTIKNAVGSPRYDQIDEILSPSQVRTVANVIDDLKRDATTAQLSEAGLPKARELIGQIAPKAPAAGMFNPKYSVARAILNRLAGRVTEKAIPRMAELMENPQEMARVMRDATPTERAALVDAMLAQKVGRGAIVYGTMGASGQEQF